MTTSSTMPSSAPATPLSRACARAFTSRTVRLGGQYYRDGRVTIEGTAGDTVIGFVRGSRPKPYTVAIDFAEMESRSRLRVACTCPYFFEGYPCKHLYGALLALDASGAELVSPGALDVPIEVVPYRPDLPLEDDWFFEGDNTLRRLEAPLRPEAEVAPAVEDWEAKLKALKRSAGPWHSRAPVEAILERARPRELHYRLNPRRSEALEGLLVECFERDPETAALVPMPLDGRDVGHLGSSADGAAVTLLAPSVYRAYAAVEAAQRGQAVANGSLVPPAHQRAVLEALVATERFEVSDGATTKGLGPVALDLDAPWGLELEVTFDEGRGMIDPVLRRGEETRSVDEALAALRDGLLVFAGELGALSPPDAFAWTRQLRRIGGIGFPLEATHRVLSDLAGMLSLPPLRLPPPWSTEPVRPRPHVVFQKPTPRARTSMAEVWFDYGGTRFGMASPESAWVDADNKHVILRQRSAEEAAVASLGALGARRGSEGESTVEVPQADLPRIVRTLVARGWYVEADGRRLRRLDGHKLVVSSGEDWFDLSGEIQFEGTAVKLPEVLRALQRDGFVRLDDGSEGILPEEWLQRLTSLAQLGSRKGELFRFTKSQALLLDLLLAEQDAELDAGFLEIRARLEGVRQVRAVTEPESFSGTLRGYQREGLGWLGFLQEIGLGGCLADDMGLGKTVQVLALLDERRRARPEGAARKPTLVVAPRSLIHNWAAEAERFTPELKTLCYTGLARATLLDHLDEYDLVITTYGTVRRDIEKLREIAFDYVILDEAQAIKNATSQASKSCRLLRAEHRLALSGTPVENHLGELWSIFEFLNPRMLGPRSHFAVLSKTENVDALRLVAKALRPLILRRTKDQVLKELPAKTELTIYCELEDSEARTYAQLRDHYRTSLTQRIEKDGMDRSRMHVLEALLRLRQAACHPGLIDPSKKKQPSAKIDALVEHLREVTEEGHKALVFSQFVQLLSILRDRLDSNGFRYAYLDGQTTKRAEEIHRFQNDPECELFLISLKAGGLGLNLTAADYVFILDPWWNPAAEAQAIDRAHRIGQTRPVFAYRLIASGTVEEKILSLHEKKRRLASAIISENDQAVGDLTLDDLKLLLG